MSTVVLADDEPEVLAALGDLIAARPALELLGTACDAEAAIELVRITRPDLLILDWKMPAGGGARAATAIRELSPDTKMLALSVHADRGSVVQMLRAGAVGYLVKGATVAEIYDTIDRVLDGETVLDQRIDPVPA